MRAMRDSWEKGSGDDVEWPNCLAPNRPNSSPQEFTELTEGRTRNGEEEEGSESVREGEGSESVEGMQRERGIHTANKG